MAVRAVKDQQGRVRTGRVGAQGVGGGGGSPVLTTYNFLTSPSMPAGLSLSRATVGTYFSSSGVLTTAPINAPRFEYAYNGTVWVGAGLVVEEQRTNFASTTSDISNGVVWVPDGVTPTGNNIVAPDGTTTGTRLTESAGTAEHRHYIAINGLPATTTWTLFAKKAERIWVALRKGGNISTANFNLNTGALGTSGGGFFLSTAIQNVASGWFRCAKTDSTAASGEYFIISLGDADTGTGGGYSYAGDGTSGLYGWGAQAENGAFATSYIVVPTNVAVTRSADLVSATGTLATQLAAGPSVWEMQDQATGAISRTSFAAGAFTFPTSKLYRSFGVYPAGTDTSPYLTVGGSY